MWSKDHVRGILRDAEGRKPSVLQGFSDFRIFLEGGGRYTLPNQARYQTSLYPDVRFSELSPGVIPNPVRDLLYTICAENATLIFKYKVFKAGCRKSAFADTDFQQPAGECGGASGVASRGSGPQVRACPGIWFVTQGTRPCPTATRHRWESVLSAMGYGASEFRRGELIPAGIGLRRAFHRPFS